ncbi:oligosaccharide flippase family protein [Haloferax larsenii]|uniref:Membrane protein involved in the export of O-antigen and teichoic acid n=1 Tax=Haloferax larsenii TaxID=302484 RepID=A0A1H7SU57_HALLR|nr:polysaccharide biosynthesis C-terminal domain-containing protein [Haloferax larsenii]SEL75849.1 Membrane protein involved in the export of O-antigen and teichoic acid [Haloferax larsenii]
MGRLARASALQFIVRIGQTVAGAIATIYFVRELGVDTFGFYVLTMATVNWITVPSVGIRSSVMKRVSDSERRSRFYSAGVVLQSAFVLFAALVLYLLRNQVNDYIGLPPGPYGLDAVGVITAILAATSSANIFLAVIRGEGRLEISSVFEGIWGVLRPGLQVGLVVFGGGVFALLAGEFFAAAFIVGVTPVVVNARFVLPTSDEFKQLYDYGRYSWLSNLKSMSYSWLDTIILGLFVGKALIGTYEVAWRISALFTILPASFGKTLFPTVSEYSSQDRYEDIAEAVGRSLSFATLFAIPGLVGALIIGDGVLSLYGKSVTDISAGYSILAILCIGRVVESGEIILMQVLNALDLPERTFKISIIFVISNIVLNGILISIFGVVGAAVATSTSIAVGTALAVRALPDELNLKFDSEVIKSQVVASLIMAVVLLGMIQMASPESELLVLVYVGIGGTVYFISLSVLSEKTKRQISSMVNYRG